jgi:hypothetical protein
MTPIEIVQEYFPTATFEQARSVLWTCTGWPGAWAPKEGQTNEDYFRGQLQEAAEKSEADPEKACVQAIEEMDRAHDEFKKNYPEEQNDTVGV